MSSPGRPTLADVARRAGVSLKTASRAMNEEYGVAEATAAKVREAARELGFRPNHLARSLAAGGAARAVGLVLSAVSDPFIAALSGAVESVLAPRDLQLLTASHGDDPQRQRAIVRTFVERRLDAVIIVPAPGDASYLRGEVEHGLTVVAVDRPLEGVEVDTVLMDNRAGGHEAVNCLVRRGHRRIALLGNDHRIWTLQERRIGYLEGLTAAGLTHDPRLEDLDCRDLAAAVRSVTAMLRLPDPPTAVVATQIMTGRGAARASRETGVRLETAVFDELVEPDLLAVPPVLVVASDPDRLGRLAANLVIERLDGLATPPRSLVLPPLYSEQVTA